MQLDRGEGQGILETKEMLDSLACRDLLDLKGLWSVSMCYANVLYMYWACVCGIM